MTGATRDAAEALEGATAALAGAGSPLERARLHYLLGSNAFALGDAAACEASHADALAWAERAGSVEWQARALSGLGDAFYAQGRMLTALRSYDRCIALARAHGLGRVELSNRFMLGFCRYFACDFEVARAEHRATVELARAARDRNMELIGYESLAVGGLDLVEAETILADATCGEAIAREIGARRYLSVLLGAKAWALYRLGRTAEGDAAIEESLAHCRATSERFFAPGALGILAGAARDAGIRARALAEAEALLAEGCVSHNHLWFYRLGMETALDWREWERASRYADALAAYTREEPLPWSDFWIARARALDAHGRGARDAAATAELRRLRDFAAVRGIRLALPALDAALAGR
jgi:tetratricopeptide (TPR) repeat protein